MTHSDPTHHMALVELTDEAEPHLMEKLVERARSVRAATHQPAGGGGPLVAASMWQAMATYKRIGPRPRTFPGQSRLVRVGRVAIVTGFVLETA